MDPLPPTTESEILEMSKQNYLVSWKQLLSQDPKNESKFNAQFVYDWARIHWGFISGDTQEVRLNDLLNLLAFNCMKQWEFLLYPALFIPL